MLPKSWWSAYTLVGETELSDVQAQKKGRIELPQKVGFG